MLRKHREGLEWLEFELFQGLPALKHALFTRRGGVSGGPYAALNFGSSTGDDPALVAENQRRALAALEVDAVARCHQVHGAHVAAVAAPTRCAELQADGLCTAVAGLGLLMLYGDCQVIMLYDPVRRVAANVHCGWRGNVHNIAGAAVAAMTRCYGVRPCDLLAGISPSLAPRHAEFVNWRSELPPAFQRYRRGDCHFDLWAITRDQLCAAGLHAANIEIAGISSYDTPDDHYSHRRDRGLTGRNAGLIAIG